MSAGQPSPLQQLHVQSSEPHGGGGGGMTHGVTSRIVAVLLSPAPRDVGSGHRKKRWAHSACEHEAPSPEVNVPSDASRHTAAMQHEHLQSSPPQGDGRGGGQAVESSKEALTLPGEFSFVGLDISPGDGHLRSNVRACWLRQCSRGNAYLAPSGVWVSALTHASWPWCRPGHALVRAPWPAPVPSLTYACVPKQRTW